MKLNSQEDFYLLCRPICTGLGVAPLITALIYVIRLNRSRTAGTQTAMGHRNFLVLVRWSKSSWYCRWKRLMIHYLKPVPH